MAELTKKSSFDNQLIGLLQKSANANKMVRINLQMNILSLSNIVIDTYLIVSRNVFLSVISSGMRLKIFFNAVDFLFNS